MSKNIFLSLILIGSVLFGFSCKSSMVVKKLVNQDVANTNKSETKKIDGVMYHLPKTVVQVTVPIKKVTKTPGDFKDFVPCFFSASESDGMVTEESQSFSLMSPNFSSRGIPDTSETYVISTKGKYFESKTLFVEYGTGNVLQKGEAESKNDGLEFAIKAVATAASVAAKIAPLASSVDDSSNNTALLELLSKEHKCYEILKTKNILDTDASKVLVEKQISKILTPKPAALPSPEKALPQKKLKPAIVATPTPDISPYTASDTIRENYQRALATFEELKKLEGQRNHVLGKDNLNLPADTHKAVIEKNDELIEAYRAAFLGRVTPEIFPANFEYAPTADNSYSPLLFTYSPDYGVCKDGLIKSKSMPIKPGFGFSKPDTADSDNPEKCGNTTETTIKAVWLNVKKSAEQNNFLAKIQNASDASARADKSRGWFYRIPADADISFLRSEIPCGLISGSTKYNCSPFKVQADVTNIKITYSSGAAETSSVNNNEQLAITEMQIAQLGAIASVPATTAGRSSSTSIVLDPATGAMKNYKSSSTALIDKSILEDAQKAADSVIDAADPLNKKKRELEELKTQNEINTEKKKLSNSNTNSDSENPR
jgi:hypothetical protein